EASRSSISSPSSSASRGAVPYETETPCERGYPVNVWRRDSMFICFAPFYVNLTVRFPRAATMGIPASQVGQIVLVDRHPQCAHGGEHPGPLGQAGRLAVGLESRGNRLR